MPYKPDDFFGFSAFDPSRMAQGFRDAAHMGAQQSREAFSRLQDATTDATKTVEDTFYVARSGSFALGLKAADAMRSSADLSIAHMQALMGVRSVSELVELQSAFVRRQAELTVENVRDLQEATRKVTEEVTKPGRDAAERAMAGFKAA
ncbi:phasin [Neorhizobium huautlense]|uniref:Phasin n=1 Tax=Neorhizobium huautlense TaxID=67774 RepID=A0ABT9PTC3_9HYPH|nr:TIGR01841 family phasin [Neorhizobium huautlense]MDP9837713.1 phasin [Neorhizobium huautlense]